MATQFASLSNLRFLLHEVHGLAPLLSFNRFEDYDPDSVDILLQAAYDFAANDMFPFYQAMDSDPAVFEDGKIRVHPQIRKILDKAAEGGWVGATFDFEQGGMQLPQLVKNAALHLMEAANNSVVGYIGLTTGAARLILSFGDAYLQETFIPPLLSASWMGTMALTEPQAGSSMIDLRTTAKPSEEGYYQIRGQKIFISGGDHDQADNFVHLMLARIEGAPKGVGGISLFVVPKMRPGDGDGLEDNDVVTVADFQKMGQRGYCTAHLVMGEHDNCRGWLLGEANKGLKQMFQMMNAARIDVGLTAASTATAAYFASLEYANERSQGRALGNKGKETSDEGPTLIVKHPDVKRMLLLQKVITEGAISLLLECSRFADLQEVSSGEESEDYRLLLELLTPIAKTYPSEKGREAIDNGLQVLGGYGYCMDFPLQQYYRDVRIMAIYEGTSGIQALDLLGRKIVMKDGKALKLLLKEITVTLQEAKQIPEFKKQTEDLQDGLARLQTILGHLLKYAKAGEPEPFLADASLFMQLMGNLVVAWQWLKMGIAAKKAMNEEETMLPTSFYEDKLLAMRFYFRYELPQILGLEKTLLDPDILTLDNND